MNHIHLLKCNNNKRAEMHCFINTQQLLEDFQYKTMTIFNYRLSQKINVLLE